MIERAVKSIQTNNVSSKKHPGSALPEIVRSPDFSNSPDLAIHRKASCACGGGCPACQAKLSDLKVSQPNDPAEIEADQIADRVMRTAELGSISAGRAPVSIQAKHSSASDGAQVSDDIGNKINSSRGGGSALDLGTRGFMESRLGGDFSGVRVHTGDHASQLSCSINAKAFTLGSDIFFGAGEYRPETHSGKRLLAHELTHVRQGCGIIRRCANPKVNDPKYDAFATKLKGHAKYTALADKTEADEVLVEAKKKPSCLDLLGKFQTLLDTPEKSQATITVETQASTATAVTAEKARTAKPAEAKNLTIEETASADPKRTYVKIAGKFGGGKYEVDKTDPKNIVVRAKVFLKAAGTGKVADVDSVKQMEDGIEKAASAKGFIVDIDFVNAAGNDAFEVDVNPGEWEDATNWSGGEPLGFAHELFHLMYYEVDRYDYIASHSTNQSMTIPNRITWFLMQLKKPAGWDNPASIAASGPHPLDDDICRVAGLPEADCIKKRKTP